MKYKNFFDDTFFIALISNFKASSWLRLNASLVQIHEQEEVDLKARPAKGWSYLKESWHSFRLSNSELDQYKGQKAILSFIVNMDGEISETKLTESPGLQADKIILRAYKKLNIKWLPAEKNDVLVRSKMNITLAL